MNNNCVFCLLREEPSRYFEQFRVNTLHKSKSFKIINDLSPLSSYHILIVSNNHNFSMLELDNEKAEELTQIKTEISKFYSKELNQDTFFFEHGNCNGNLNSSSCIEHAHLHAIPLSENVIKSILGNMVRIHGKPTGYKKGRSYLMAGAQPGNNILWSDKKVKRQFFRYLLCDLKGNVSRSNWQNCYHTEAERIISNDLNEDCKLLWEKFNS